MRVHVVSDVHGSADALAVAGKGADALICLGDLVLFVDYDDHRVGIFADLFGADAATTFIGLRTARRFDEARDYSRALWDSLQEERGVVIERMIRRQYDELFAVMPTPAYLTYGNVDVPRFYDDYIRPDMQLLDGATTEI